MWKNYCPEVIDINTQRLIAEFFELVQIPSLSKKEGKLAQVLTQKLQDLGLEVKIDEAGKKVEGETGNIIATLPGKTDGPKILLSAHMDTVTPGEGIRPVLENGVIHSAGDTILGADDKAGITSILEVLRILKEEGLKHPTLVIVFSIGEEVGLLGVKNLVQEDIQADMGLVLDSSGPVGQVITRGPTQSRIKVLIKGKAAHAGVAPEEGVSAILIAAEAIRRMKLGRIDSETTANIGTINGGQATNIIPDQVIIEGEARSHSLEKLAKQHEMMKRAFIEAANDLAGIAKVEINMEYPVIKLLDNSPVIEIIKEAGRKINLPIELVATGGGSDANLYNSYGIPTVNLAIGMDRVHTIEENIRVEDLEKITQLLLEIVKVSLNWRDHS